MTKCNDLTDKYLKLDCDFSPNLDFLNGEFDNYRILGLQGGERSLKEASIQRFLIQRMVDGFKDNVLYINHGATPSSIFTIQDTELQIEDMGLSDKIRVERTNRLIEFNGAKITFRSSDLLYYASDDYIDEFDIIVICELADCEFMAKEATRLIHSSKKIIAPYVPVSKNSIINDLFSMGDFALVKTNYKYNKFLSKKASYAIDEFKNKDLDFYTKFGLGEFVYGS